ncbi:RYamide receptor-like [Oculina patagonica]
MEGGQLLVCVSAPLAIFGFVFFAVTFCLGVFGNLFVICTVCRESNLNTPFNYLVVNLAVSDMCVFFFSVPLVVFSECFSWPFGELACRFSRPLFLVFTGVSVCTMITLSYERYLVVVKPLAPKLTRKKVLWVIAFIWILASLVFGLPRSFTFGLTTEKGILLCDPVGGKITITTLTKIMRIICTLVMPLIVVSWSYIRVMRKLKHDLAVIGDAYASRDMVRSRAKRNIKTMRLLVTIILVFVACFLPFNMATVVDDLYPAYEEWRYNETVESISRMLQVSYSCFNPIVLCLLSADFRKALSELCTVGITRFKGQRRVFVLSEIQQSSNSTYSAVGPGPVDTSL